MDAMNIGFGPPGLGRTAEQFSLFERIPIDYSIDYIWYERFFPLNTVEAGTRRIEFNLPPSVYFTGCVS